MSEPKTPTNKKHKKHKKEKQHESKQIIIIYFVENKN